MCRQEAVGSAAVPGLALGHGPLHRFVRSSQSIGVRAWGLALCAGPLREVGACAHHDDIGVAARSWISRGTTWRLRRGCRYTTQITRGEPPALPSCRESCRGDNLPDLLRPLRVVTATFPSSRSATNLPHRTVPQAPSQCTSAPGVRCTDPGFGFLIQELHTDQQQAPFLANAPYQLDTAPFVALAASHPRRSLKDGAEMCDAELCLSWPALHDVADAFFGDEHTTLASHIAWKDERRRNPAGGAGPLGLHRTIVREKASTAVAISTQPGAKCIATSPRSASAPARPSGGLAGSRAARRSPA